MTSTTSSLLTAKTARVTSARTTSATLKEKTWKALSNSKKTLTTS